MEGMERKLDHLVNGQITISRQLEEVLSRSEKRAGASSRAPLPSFLNPPGAPTRRASRVMAGGIDPGGGAGGATRRASHVVNPDESIFASQETYGKDVDSLVRDDDDNRGETKTEEPIEKSGSFQQPLTEKNYPTSSVADAQEPTESTLAAADSDNDSDDSEDEKKFRAINQFRLIDTNGNRRLDLDEILSGAKILGLTDSEARSMYNKMEKDEGDEVVLDKFLKMYEHMRATTLSDEIAAPILRDTGEWMIDPRSNFRITWDLTVMMPFLLYLVIMLPFRFAFDNDARTFSWIYWFETIIGESLIIPSF
jgi:hypothetical protein